MDTDKLADVAFKDALGNMSDSSIEILIGKFEDAAQNEEGIEFWYARDLQKLFDYDEWRNFQRVIEKAKLACNTSGHEVSDHFVDVNKMIELGKGAHRQTEDMRLTRYACYLIAQNGDYGQHFPAGCRGYACYLIAQNGDSRKNPVAFAQTYFAIQTRRQEIRDEDETSYIPLSEDKKRLLLRDEIKEHNKRLASAAKGAGVIEPVDFAVFQNFGYRGLYGGLDRVGIQRRKGLKSRSNILDHMGSTELAANLFRATQAEEKLKRDGIKGKQNANKAERKQSALRCWSESSSGNKRYWWDDARRFTPGRRYCKGGPSYAKGHKKQPEKNIKQKLKKRIANPVCYTDSFQ